MSDSPTLLFPRVLDATIRSAWKSCPHSFFRRHIQGLTKPRSNVHLHFGGALARGLEVARRSFYADPDRADALEDGCAALIEFWGDFEPPPYVSRTEANKTLANCLLALQEYCREWPLDDPDAVTHVHDGKPCIEYSFALPIPGAVHPDTGEPILYAGRFDQIIDYQGATWGLDDKSTSTDPNSDSYRNQWKLRGQFSGYCWGAREYGLPLRGFMIRGIGVMKTQIVTGWSLTPRPSWMIDMWLEQLKQDVNEMCVQYSHWKQYKDDPLYGETVLTVAPAFPYSFDHACSDFGGCQYLDLCTSEHPERWESEYITSHWHPLAKDAAP